MMAMMTVIMMLMMKTRRKLAMMIKPIQMLTMFC